MQNEHEATDAGTIPALNAHALEVWNRVDAKNQDAKASYPLTEEQIAAREELGRTISGMLSKPGVLKSIGAFITPGKNEAKGTLLVACTIPLLPIHFVNPDGMEEETRPTSFNLNATIPLPSAPKRESSEIAVAALSYSDLRKRQMELKAAANKR